MTDKPKFPEVAPTITVAGLTFTLLHDFDRFSNGKMLMKYADCTATFEGEIADGEKIKGMAGAALGGKVFVEVNGRCWAINANQLVAAVLDAEKPYLRGET